MERQYVGARYVPVFADPLEWDDKRSFERLTIVSYLGSSYTSKKDVPSGVLPTNTEYWALTGNYNAQVEQYRQQTEELLNNIVFGNSYIITVGKSGCNYTTINDAVTAMRNKITEGLHVGTKPVIMIYPGNYDESVDLLNNPGIILYGACGLNTVHISATKVSYPNSPIHISGSGTVCNINMYGSGSYAMHYEYQNGQTSGTVQFINCSFSSTIYASAGIGLGPNCYLTFRDCEFVATGSPEAGVFFFHGYPYAATGMEITLDRCTILDTNNNDAHTIRWDDVTRTVSDTPGTSIVNFRINNTIVHPATFEFQKYTGEYVPYVESGNNGNLMPSYGNSIIALNSGKATKKWACTANMFAIGNDSAYTLISIDDCNKYNWSITELYKDDDTNITGSAEVTIQQSETNTLLITVKDVSLIGHFVRINLNGIANGKNL